MNIIKIDDLKRRYVNQSDPAISFYKGGRIAFNSKAGQILNLKYGDYLHFYTNKEGTIWLKTDNSPAHGLQLKFYKKKEWTTFCRKLTLTLFGEIIQPVKFNLEADEFGKYKLIKI